MKKTVAVILSVVMILFCFSACSKSSAEMTEENITQTTEIVFKALKDFNTEDLGKYVSSSTLSVIMATPKSMSSLRSSEDPYLKISAMK